MIVGYARVSTADQKLEGQRDALLAAGAERTFADTITGAARHRPELDRLLDQLRAGDVVVVTKYDRLARSLKDLLEIVEVIKGIIVLCVVIAYEVVRRWALRDQQRRVGEELAQARKAEKAEVGT